MPEVKGLQGEAAQKKSRQPGEGRSGLSKQHSKIRLQFYGLFLPSARRVHHLRMVGTHRPQAGSNESGAEVGGMSARLPPYGRQLLAAQRRGLNVPYLCLSLAWALGRVYPRVVIPDDFQPDGADFTFVKGLDCLVVHHDEPERALDVARLALLHGAKLATVFDAKSLQVTYSDDVRASL